MFHIEDMVLIFAITREETSCKYLERALDKWQALYIIQ